MSDEMDEIISAAAKWCAASRNDDMDWTGFTAWLAADPRHARAYDEVALADSLLDDHRHVLAERAERADLGGGEPIAPPSPVKRRSNWGRWAGLALAASVAAALFAPQFWNASAIYQTQDKAQRIALRDGSSIVLAPHSQLTLSGPDQAQIALAGGAWFDVRHDPSRVMAITAGQLEIRDIGTSFDVQAQPDNVRISVTDGQVTVASQSLAQPIRLERGRSLLFDSKHGSAEVRPASVTGIGAWRNGRLFYEGTPLPLVLDDLSRYAGVRVTLPDSLRDRHFAGSLVVNDGEAAVRDLAEVMGLELDRSAGGLRLRERNR